MKSDSLEKFTTIYKQTQKKPLKGCKSNNKIQTDKNIEKVQDRQQDTNKEKKK